MTCKDDNLFCSKSDCIHPRNGQLVFDDFPKMRNGLRRQECRMCFGVRMRKAKMNKSSKDSDIVFGNMTRLQVSTCKFSTATAQAFYLGRV